MFLTYFLGLHLNSEFISKGGTENKKLCLSSIKSFTLITKVPEPWGNIYSEHKATSVTHSLFSFTHVHKSFIQKSVIVDTLTYISWYTILCTNI